MKECLIQTNKPNVKLISSKYFAQYICNKTVQRAFGHSLSLQLLA
jgi:hypothetical protein